MYSLLSEGLSVFLLQLLQSSGCCQDGQCGQLCQNSQDGQNKVKGCGQNHRAYKNCLVAKPIDVVFLLASI